MNIPVDNSDDAKFVMAPMIDMVFLLLVFFMCASQLSQTQSLPMEIPTATKAVVPTERPDRFVVNIDKDGNLYGCSVPVELADLKTMVLVQGLEPEHQDLPARRSEYGPQGCAQGHVCDGRGRRGRLYFWCLYPQRVSRL